jgi:Rrf2 family nitric oxide-sensitive transcriptional repressor
MHLTQYTDYSLRILIYLYLNQNRKVTIKEISEAFKISRNHLTKIVQKLGIYGFIDSVPGAKGGVKLAKNGGKKKIADVVIAMEPNFFIAECFNPEGNCVISPVCELQFILAKAMNAFMDSLKEYTFDDIMKNSKDYKKIFNSFPKESESL